jgi:hypothetical protein
MTESACLPLDEELEAGRRQWTVAWRKFARQWTQPQLLKLTDSVMGGRYLHSSQISGFATGKLREPAPKVFVVIGRLNQALAQGSLPSELRDLWEGRQALKDKGGSPLDSVGCFRAFTGQLDLGFGQIRTIPEDQVDDANKRLGRFVRLELAKAGVDFIDELPELVASSSPLLQSVVLGTSMSADDLLEALPFVEIAMKSRGIDVDISQLWNVMENS